jgi:chaperone modulatory protein CbpM
MNTLAPVVLEEELSLEELSRSCACDTAWLIELVHEGALEPSGSEPAAWRFCGMSLRRARVASHLRRDLQLNAAGVALALDLLEEIRVLRLQAKFGASA